MVILRQNFVFKALNTKLSLIEIFQRPVSSKFLYFSPIHFCNVPCSGYLLNIFEYNTFYFVFLPTLISGSVRPNAVPPVTQLGVPAGKIQL